MGDEGRQQGAGCAPDNGWSDGPDWATLPCPWGREADVSGGSDGAHRVDHQLPVPYGHRAQVSAWWGWSWLLTVGGVFGLWLAGRKSAWGWAVGLAMQVLWMTYAVVTHQYGFVVSGIAYGAVYGLNFYRWWTPKAPLDQPPYSQASAPD
jgi:hypothetical protein